MLECIKRRYASRRRDRQARDRLVELLSDPFSSYPLIATNRKILSLLPVDALHRLFGKAATDAECSAIQWELTRRQGLGTLKVRRGGFGLATVRGGLMVLCAGASAAQQPADPDDLQILAVCGESIGMAFYDNPPGHEGWSDDRLTDGSYAFARDKAGRLRVIYRTKGADWVDEEADGGKVVEVSSDVGRGEVAANYLRLKDTQGHDYYAAHSAGVVLLAEPVQVPSEDAAPCWMMVDD